MFLDFKTPKEIPDNCAKYLKMYTNGELTLPDYVKQLKICKQNEEIATQIAKTSKSGLNFYPYYIVLDFFNAKDMSTRIPLVTDFWQPNFFRSPAGTCFRVIITHLLN